MHPSAVTTLQTHHAAPRAGKNDFATTVAGPCQRSSHRYDDQRSGASPDHHWLPSHKGRCSHRQPPKRMNAIQLSISDSELGERSYQPGRGDEILRMLASGDR